MVSLMGREEEQYHVSSGSYFYNNENQLIHLSNSSGEITKHWTGTYYLIDDAETKYNLGNTSVIYDPTDYKIYLFGDNYQVYQDTTIEKHSKMTEIVRNVGASFYKLEDRKYLVVAPVITDENGTETFDSFLLVELDKNGNATLLNHEVQKRTLHAMTIVTNEYKFDIANESDPSFIEFQECGFTAINDLLDEVHANPQAVELLKCILVVDTKNRVSFEQL